LKFLPSYEERTPWQVAGSVFVTEVSEVPRFFRGTPAVTHPFHLELSRRSNHEDAQTHPGRCGFVVAGHARIGGPFHTGAGPQIAAADASANMPADSPPAAAPTARIESAIEAPVK
jgi:hypothetical protein